MNKKEQKRIKRSKEKVLEILRLRKDGITNLELSEMGFLRYGGFLGTLYKEGYKIQKESMGNGIYKYTLLEEPKEKVLRPSAYDVLSEHIRLNTKTEISSEAIKKLCDNAGVMLRVKAGTYQ